LTIVMITHDLDLLRRVADRAAVLDEGKVQAWLMSNSRMDWFRTGAPRPGFHHRGTETQSSDQPFALCAWCLHGESAGSWSQCAIRESCDSP
jgi:energy-coupling factor transporter ATP-binding protein EcfA2